MRIAFIVGSLNMGGLEKVTVHMANALSNDYDIDLIILRDNDQFYTVDKKINIIEGNIDYSLLERLKQKIFRLFKKNLLTIYYPKEIKFITDLVSKNNYSSIIAVDGSNAMIMDNVYKKLETKNSFNFITWIHNNYNTYFNNYYRLYKKELSNALSNSNHVVTLTKNDANDYCRWNQSTITIYNPVTISMRKPSSLKNKEILFVARLVKEHKGLDYLIDIGKKLKESDWIIRVLGDGADRKWFESQIHAHELTDIFILEGSVKEDIEKYYEKASIFISTSKWEGLPLVMIEAISSGLPIISFDHSGAIEILGDNEYGITIDMGDTEGFYKELKELMDSYNQRKFWSEKSLKRSQDFKVDAICKKWNSIIS